MSLEKPPRGCDDLTAWLAWQEKAHPKSWDLGLSRIGEVWKRMGAPKIAEHVISIAGTNGKGSCVCWTEAICQSHGISVASFSSPHLLDYRERIRFDGEMVDAGELCCAFDFIDEKRGDISLTYFEWSALAGFYLMARKYPQVAALEVGLGGRLDAVNLLDADATIFTRIGLDHENWLGNRVEDIAREKAGIMRAGKPVICADKSPDKVLLEQAEVLNAPLWQYGKTFDVQETEFGLTLILSELSYHLPRPQFLFGEHQYGHLGAVVQALSPWFDLKIPALSKAVLMAKNPARLMIKMGEPRYIIDVAHNVDSAVVLADFLQQQRRQGECYHVICAMLGDKNHREVLRALASVTENWYFASLTGERGFPSLALLACAEEVGIAPERLHSYDEVLSALAAAECSAEKKDGIVVMGSFVTVSKVLKQWKEK